MANPKHERRQAEVQPRPSRNGWAQGLDIKSIEQIAQHLPFDCRFNLDFGYSFRTADASGNVTYIPAFCHQLRCRTCAKLRCHELTSVLNRACVDHGLDYYLVLTLPGTVPCGDQESVLKMALSRFLQEARRTFKGRKLAYAWALGIGDGGNLHVNALVNIDLRRSMRYGKPVPWLKPVWHRLTCAHQVKLTPIAGGTHWKVVHYLLVDMLRTALFRPHLGRRCGSSRCLSLRYPEFEGGNDTRMWTRVARPTAYYARLHRTDPFPVSNGEVVVNSDAMASTAPLPGEPPLDRRPAAGGPTVPAGGAAGVGPHPLPPGERCGHE